MEALELPAAIVEPWGRSTRHSNLVYVPDMALREVGMSKSCEVCVLRSNTKYDRNECSNHNCGRGVWMEFEDAIAVKLGSKP